MDTRTDISVFNKLFVEDHQYTGTHVEATSFDGTQSTYLLAEVKCGVGNFHEFVLKEMAIDMPLEEGGLIGYNVDTPTMKALLDLAEQHALRSDTSLNIQLTRSESRKQAEECVRLGALEATEQPLLKDPSLYPDHHHKHQHLQLHPLSPSQHNHHTYLQPHYPCICMLFLITATLTASRVLLQTGFS